VGKIPGRLAGDHPAYFDRGGAVARGARRSQMVRAGVIGSAIVSALEKLDLKFPKVDAASLQEFKQVRKALLEEDKSGAKKAAAGKAAKK
jgi:hypothetical protein